MTGNDQEHAEIEGLLKRVRPSEPLAELRTHVLAKARETWLDVSTSVPWQIPVRRLVASAAAAAILVSLANLHGDRASTYQFVAPSAAERIVPFDPDVAIGSDVSLTQYAVTAIRLDRAPVDYLEKIREALRETERNEATDRPAPVERRSRLPRIPSSLNS